jgi:hypothetical protein
MQRKHTPERLERRHALQPPQPEVWVSPHAAALPAVVCRLPEASQRLLRGATAATAGAVCWPSDFYAALFQDPGSSNNSSTYEAAGVGFVLYEPPWRL